MWDTFKGGHFAGLEFAGFAGLRAAQEDKHKKSPTGTRTVGYR
jgi:hypothetical protein